jgi:hypothetical protein
MKIEDLLTFNPRLGEGALLTPQPSIEQILRDHYERLVGKGGDSEALTSAYMAAMVAAASAEAPAPTQPETAAAADEPVHPAARQEAPRSEAPREAPREEAPRAEAGQRPGDTRPMRDPLDLFKAIGLDVSVAGVDVMKGLRQGSEGGSMMPLATGLAGALLGVIATAERRKG